MTSIPLHDLTVVYDSPSHPFPAQIIGGDSALSDGADDTYVYMYGRTVSSGGGAALSLVSARFDPIDIGDSPTLRMRASGELFEAATQVRYGIELYDPDATISPSSNIGARFAATTVVLPAADGTPQDVDLAWEDWNTGDPAPGAELAAFFAGGGQVRIGVTAGGGMPRSVSIRYLELFFEAAQAQAYRRVYPTDRGRAYPPSKAYGRGGRRGGGYL